MRRPAKKPFRSELEFVAWLARHAPRRAPGLLTGIGDDAAVVHVPGQRDLLIKTELSVEGVHFNARLHPARAVGHRALSRALSDLAAMGGKPRFALLSLALSRRATRAWVEEFYAGFNALARRFGVTLIGGDTAVVAGATTANVALIGEAARGQALLRSGAKPGDWIFVSGGLGYSALGLGILKRGRRFLPGLAEREADRAQRAHLYPEPRCSLGRHLAERRLPSAGMDISDGLSLDLFRLCKSSGVGARVWADWLPIPRARRGANESGALLQLALNGGEDYELLFTVAPARRPQIPPKFDGVPIYPIGEITAARRLRLILSDGRERPLVPAGYDCFVQATNR